MSEAKPPYVGQKVFVEEMQLWGEVVELYHDGADLISKVRVMINGKPTVIDVTLLIVQAAELVKFGAVLFVKIKAAAKRICTALGLCKAKPIMPKAVTKTIIDLRIGFNGKRPTENGIIQSEALREKLKKLD
jgi:hypothetical protein